MIVNFDKRFITNIIFGDKFRTVRKTDNKFCKLENVGKEFEARTTDNSHIGDYLITAIASIVVGDGGIVINGRELVSYNSEIKFINSCGFASFLEFREYLINLYGVNSKGCFEGSVIRWELAL